MTALTRITILLEQNAFLTNTGNGQVVFSDRQNEIHLEQMDWEDMGSPQSITMTIEPGDLLNAC